MNAEKSVHFTSKATSKAASTSRPQKSRLDLREFLNEKRTQEPAVPGASTHEVPIFDKVQCLQLEVRRLQKW